MAQTPKPIDLARSLQEASSYDAAITEYKRQLFFFPGDDRTAEVYRQMGLCYRGLADWTNAATMLRTAIELHNHDSLRSECYLELAVTHIASGNYSAAELRLIRLSSFAQFPTIRKRASFLLLLAYIYQDRWDAVGAGLDSGLVSWESQATKSEIVTLLKEIVDREKSPSKAKWLSTFVPGLGQLYAGHPYQAVDAMAVNGFFGYCLYDQVVSVGNVADVTYWLFAFHRYWMGNREKAALLVTQDRAREEERVRREILHSVRLLAD